MNVQVAERDGRKWATLPFEEYERLREAAEELADIAAYDRAVAELARGEDELIPGEVVDRLFSGESRLKVWREFRGLTQAQLAEAASLAQATIAQIEGGQRKGSAAVLKRVARALRIDLDDLVP